MNKEETALRAFIIEKLSEAGLKADETTIQALLAGVSLEEGEPNEAEEIRTIRIKEDADGRVTAKSIKLYNLLKVSPHDLMDFLLKEATVFIAEDTKVKVFLALLILLHEFTPKLAYSFNETDARILLAINSLNVKNFAVSDIEDAYSRRFGEPLKPGQAERAVDFFKSKQIKVLKYLGDGKYTKKERMVYERN